MRSKGGFRLYSPRAVARLEWIQKLQDMGFSLTEIKAFLRVWEASATAPKAMATVREIFSDKLRETRETITRLGKLADELQESLDLPRQLPLLRAGPHPARVRHVRDPRARGQGRPCWSTASQTLTRRITWH